MKKVLQILNFKTAKKVYNVYISEMVDDEEEDIIYPLIQEWGTFSIGNDDPSNEMILYPGNWTVRIKLSSRDELYDVSDRFAANGATVIIKRVIDGVESNYFQGDCLSQSIGDDPVNRIISLQFFDDYSYLNTPLDLAFSSAGYQRMSDYLKLLTKGIDLTFNFQTDIKFQYLLNPYPDATLATGYLNNLGCSEHLYYNHKDLFSQKGDVLKSILINLCSKGVVTFNRQFIISPMFYNGNPTTTIKKGDILSGTDKIEYIKAYKGLRIKYIDWQTDYGKTLLLGTVEENEDHTLKYPDDVLDYTIAAAMDSIADPVSDLITQYSIFTMFVDESLYPTSRFILTDSAQYKKYDGSYSAPMSLMVMAGNIIWRNIQTARKKRTFEISGTDWNYNNFFLMDDDQKIYRPLKFTYNDVNNSTEIVGIDCPQVISDTSVESPVYRAHLVTNDGENVTEELIKNTLGLELGQWFFFEECLARIMGGANAFSDYNFELSNSVNYLIAASDVDNDSDCVEVLRSDSTFFPIDVIITIRRS